MASGYDCEFVDGPPKELHYECSICLMVLRQPCLVECCGHHFCKWCLDGVTKEKKTCPLCNQEELNSMRNKGLERVLNEKRVYCSNKKIGCEWSGELCQLDSHLNESVNTASPKSDIKRYLDGCQFVEVRCKFCPATLKRNEMKKHLDECSNKPIQCKHCKNHTATPQDMTEKHEAVCPKFPVVCPNKCGATMHRRNVGKHVETTCPLSKLQCAYRHVGCEVVLTPKEMEKHAKSPLGVASHLDLMDKAYASLKASKSGKGEEEKKALIRQIDDLKKENLALQANHIRQVKGFERQIVALQNEVRYLGDVIDQLETENRQLKAKLGKKSGSYYGSEDIDYGGGGATAYGKGTKPSSFSKPSPDKDKEEGLGWGTALSLAAGLGLGIAGAAGVAALASKASSDKEEKSKNNSWF